MVHQATQILGVLGNSANRLGLMNENEGCYQNHIKNTCVMQMETVHLNKKGWRIGHLAWCMQHRRHYVSWVSSTNKPATQHITVWRKTNYVGSTIFAR
jgi:hypothetical protein